MVTVLQLIDNFILNNNITVGLALAGMFGMSVLAALAVRSLRALALNCVVFGLVFVATPSSLAALEYKFAGLFLLVAGPVIYFAAGR